MVRKRHTKTTVARRESGAPEHALAAGAIAAVQQQRCPRVPSQVSGE